MPESAAGHDHKSAEGEQTAPLIDPMWCFLIEHHSGGGEFVKVGVGNLVPVNRKGVRPGHQSE